MSETRTLEDAFGWLEAAQSSAIRMTDDDQPKLRVPESLGLEVTLANAAANVAIADALTRIANAMERKP